MATMGLREANQYFSRLLDLVRRGEEVTLTERGRPIAVVRPVGAGEADDAIHRLEHLGVLRPPTRKPAARDAWKPRVIRGQALSRTVADERDSR